MRNVVTKRQPNAAFASERNAAEEASAHIPLPFADLMPPQAAAAYLGVEVATLAMWRSTKHYPLPYIKVGRLVHYRKSHLDAFLAARTVDLTVGSSATAEP